MSLSSSLSSIMIMWCYNICKCVCCWLSQEKSVYCTQQLTVPTSAAQLVTDWLTVIDDRFSLTFCYILKYNSKLCNLSVYLTSCFRSLYFDCWPCNFIDKKICCGYFYFVNTSSFKIQNFLLQNFMCHWCTKLLIIWGYFLTIEMKN